MYLKLKAALITVSVILTGFVTGFVMSYLPNWAVAVLALAFAGYLVYTLALAQLKWDQTVDEINQKYQK